MAQLRRLALVVLLFALVGGDVPGVAGPLAASLTPGHRDHVWVGQPDPAVRVRITGTVRAALSPGAWVPIEVGLTNPNPRALSIRRVKVAIVGIAAPLADPAHPCTKADFGLRQMRRGVLRIPAQRYVDLAGLGVPIQDWPQVSMTNRPVNQDGCQGASLTLRYRAHKVRRSAA